MDLPLNPEFPYHLAEDDFVEMSGNSQPGTGIEWSTLFAFARELRFAPGEALITQFQHDASIYVLTQGELEVRVGSSPGEAAQTIARIEPIAVIGEQSFLDSGPRTASVFARTSGTAYRLSRDGFDRMRAREPELAWAFLLDIARSLSTRSRKLLAKQAAL